MKSFFTFFLIISCSYFVFGQGVQLHKSLKTKTLPASPNYTGDEILENQEIDMTDVESFLKADPEVNIGESRYDLQTNGTINNRFTRTEDGEMYAVWTMGFQETAFPDRGTGYNKFDGENWGEMPSARLEQTARTGWPNYTRTESGKEFIVNHVFDNGAYRLHFLRRDNEDQDWVEGDIPTNTPSGTLWPSSGVGGANGETIHVVSICTPSGALGGTIYEGVDSHPLYYRSQDGGETWDIIDMILPGVDSTAMIEFGRADGYSVDVQGDNVAIAFYDTWNDVVLMKSSDNGDTWTKTIVNDFVLDKYVTDRGYDILSVPYDSLFHPAQGALFTSDATGSVLLDHNGDAHVFFGNMFVIDTDTLDGGWQYYPGTFGLSYWNESMATDSLVYIQGIVDINENGVLDLNGETSPYGNSGLTGRPSAGIDADGTLYLSYEAVMEGDEYIDIQDNQHYRQTYITRSLDNGATWSNPFNIINEETTGDAQLAFFTEAVFGHMAKDVDDQIHLIYQQDFRPGLAVAGDEDPYGENIIKYVAIDVDDLISSNNEVELKTEVTLVPNPAKGQTQMIMESPTNEKSIVALYNSSGQLVWKQKLSTNVHSVDIPLNEFSEGMYYVKLNIGNQSITKKLIKM